MTSTWNDRSGRADAVLGRADAVLGPAAGYGAAGF
jgi:hypothetical protein